MYCKNRRELLKQVGALSVAGLGSLYLPTAVHAFGGPRMRKGSNQNAMNILRNLGLTANLQLCLDAGDATSFTSGQTWSDLSGGGHHFYLGADNTIAANDPTFTGHPGNRSHNDYWSFDGGDFFRHIGANPSWANDIHKDNAIFTIALWVYVAGTGSTGFIGTSGTDGEPGFYLGRSASDQYLLQVLKDTPGAARTALMAALPADRWVFLSCALDESVGASGGFLGMDMTFSTFTSTYTTPSALDAAEYLGVGCRVALNAGGSLGRLTNGSRMAMCLVWTGTKLTQTQITSIYTSTRRRFGV